MNKERLSKLAWRLSRTSAEKFSMWHYCGSACCVAGKAAFMAGYRPDSSLHRPVFFVAKGWLGLTENQAEALFTPSGDRAWGATPKQAAKVIRHLIKTGRVDWERFV